MAWTSVGTWGNLSYSGKDGVLGPDWRGSRPSPLWGLSIGGEPELRCMGALEVTGGWERLEVRPAAQTGGMRAGLRAGLCPPPGRALGGGNSRCRHIKQPVAVPARPSGTAVLGGEGKRQGQGGIWEFWGLCFCAALSPVAQDPKIPRL